MRKEYSRNKKIVILGTAKNIAAAESVLDILEDSIVHYNNSFIDMKKAVLDNATTAGWCTDIQRILDYIQCRRYVQVSLFAA